ncbi:MAG: PTS sugar transporter subunit IIA [Parachlamydiaceae bacterium]
MDLKIKDVVDILNVSETTLRRWLADGKIPAYRINQQYRFNRQEIEDWVMRQKPGKCSGDVPQPSADAIVHNQRGSKQFSLYRAINKGGVLNNISGNSKEDIIRATMKHVAADLNLDADVISDLLIDREQLQSTALGSGIAIPHTRDFLLSNHFDVVTVVLLKKPIEYGALDGKPIHTLFFLFASDDKKHLHLLAKIAHLSSQPGIHALLQSHPSRDVLLEYVKEWEGGIQQASE